LSVHPPRRQSLAADLLDGIGGALVVVHTMRHAISKAEVELGADNAASELRKF
jgi:hypothetical protein